MFAKNVIDVSSILREALEIVFLLNSVDGHGLHELSIRLLLFIAK